MSNQVVPSMSGKAKSKGTKRAAVSRRIPPLPASGRRIQECKTPYTVVNHSYVDYSLVPSSGDALPTEIDEMDFHLKVHHMLSDPAFSESIRWLWHGRAFQILVPSKFEKTACVEYFGHRRYSSFLYQLGLHGYRQLTSGSVRFAYYSEFQLRGLPHLTRYGPNPKEFRHLTPAPEYEPDFDVLHLIAPLPDDDHFGKTLTLDDIVKFCQTKGRSLPRVLGELAREAESRAHAA